MAPENEGRREMPDQERNTEERGFDEIARGLAEGVISRGRAVKLMAAAALGLGTFSALGSVAGAKKRKRRRRRVLILCNPSTGVTTLPATSTAVGPPRCNDLNASLACGSIAQTATAPPTTGVCGAQSVCVPGTLVTLANGAKVCRFFPR